MYKVVQCVKLNIYIRVGTINFDNIIRYDIANIKYTPPFALSHRNTCA